MSYDFYVVRSGRIGPRKTIQEIGVRSNIATDDYCIRREVHISTDRCKTAVQFGVVSFRIAIDGQVYSGHRDPPGQSTTYIAPGNVWDEKYRLSTFRYYPVETPINPAKLARSGFYWTGYRDRVKCFSCGLCVENWVQGDQESDKRWHRNECDFSNGVDRTNVPVEAAFTSFITRANARNSSVHVATNFHNVNVQHFSSEVNHEATPMEISSSQNTSSNNAPTSTSSSSLNQPTERSSSAQNQTQENASAEQARSELFPCRHPVNPHMISAIDRLESFKPRNGVRWPREKLKASIDELANAGFFFLGERDRVKCWYCNGGLQNWDYEDEPWTEHAKWFPMCEFLLRRKGPAYVESIVRAFPNLNRPRPTTQQPSVPAPSTSSLPPAGGGDIPPVDQAIGLAMELEYVKQAKEMGIDENFIKNILIRKYNANGRFYNSSEEFMDAIFSAAPNAINHRNNEDTNQPGPSGETAETQIKKLEESRLCQICKKEISNVVFVPCGHLTTCDKCSEGVKKCPRCKKTVQDTIQTFRA